MRKNLQNETDDKLNMGSLIGLYLKSVDQAQAEQVITPNLFKYATP